MNTQKAWRNPSLAGKKTVVGGPERLVDADGFLPDGLSLDEHKRLARLPGWKNVFRDGSDVVAAKLSEAIKQRDRIGVERERQRASFDIIDRTYSDACAVVISLTKAAENAVVIEAAEAERVTLPDFANMPFPRLVEMAAEKGISIPAGPTQRDDIVAALKLVLSPPTPPAIPPVAPAPVEPDTKFQKPVTAEPLKKKKE